MKIIGYHIADGIWNSDGESCIAGQSYLEFLLQPKPDTIRVFYDVNRDVTNLLGIMNISDKDSLALIHETKLYMPPYHLRFVAGKIFSIKRPKAFAYYANASRYVKTDDVGLQPEPSFLALRAKEIGEQVYGILSGLGLNPTSLVNPARAYEKTQLKWLYSQKREADGNSVKSGIIDEIGLEIYGRAWEDYCAGKR